MTSSASGYLLGRTPSFACQADPRFSYCLYVPRSRMPEGAPPRLLVAIHDTLRNNQLLRDQFADFAEASNSLVIAPLFPAGLGSAEELDNYKYLRFRDIRFDELLLRMTAEVAARYGVDDARFFLFGFSGGAHFVHRFLYVHPERVAAAVVAAPGSVTLPIDDYPWWAGVADFERIFGRPLDWDRMRQVPIHLVVGANDTNPGGIVQGRDHPNWVEGAAAAGGNRVERLRSLHGHLQRLGARATLEELPGVGHEIAPVVQAGIRFLAGSAPRPA
jgi:poly(3-hydroxybutyrate) depolymerase